MCGLHFEGTCRWKPHFPPLVWFLLLAAAPLTVHGYFLGGTKAVINGCEDHWMLQDRVTMPVLLQMTVCVDIRVVVPGAWVAFSYSSVRAPYPDLGLEGDSEAIYGWLLQVRHRFPLQMSPRLWHRVCLRRDVDGNKFSLEVDGRMVAERTVIAQAIPSSGSLWLGCHSTNQFQAAKLGKVELYMFRMWADLREHGLCEDGTVIGWNSQYWVMTSVKARRQDPFLLCDLKRFRRESENKATSNKMDSGITRGIGLEPRSPLVPGNVSRKHRSSQTKGSNPPSDTNPANQVATNKNRLPIIMLSTKQSIHGGLLPSGTPQINCDISQLCSNESAYYWMSVSMEAGKGNHTEDQVHNLVSTAFGCPEDGADAVHGATSFMDFCRDDGQLQIVEVSCGKPAPNISQTTCNVVLLLSRAVSACDLQLVGEVMLQKPEGQMHVERVGRNLCDNVLPSSGGFVSCTSPSSLDDICLSNSPSKITCSMFEPNSQNATQQKNESCSRAAPRFCDCTAFCDSARQFYAIRLGITKHNFNSHSLRSLFQPPFRQCGQQSQCNIYAEILKNYQAFHLECHDTQERLYSCMVILEMSGPVNGCVLDQLVQQLIEKKKSITAMSPLTRMTVCGPPGLSVDALLASNLTWVASDLQISDVCQDDPTLLKCEANEKLAVLLDESCPPQPGAESTTPSSTLTSSITAAPTSSPLPVTQPSVTGTHPTAATSEPVHHTSPSDLTTTFPDNASQQTLSDKASTNLPIIITSGNDLPSKNTAAITNESVNTTPLSSSHAAKDSTTTADKFTQSPNHTTVHTVTVTESFTAPPNYTVEYNVTTAASNHTTVTKTMRNVTVDSKNGTATNSTSSTFTTPPSYTDRQSVTGNNHTKMYNVTMETNNYTTAVPVIVSPNNTEVYNVTTAGVYYTATKNATTAGSNYATEYNVTTAGNIYKTTQNLTKNKSNYTTLYNVTPTSNNYTKVENTTTSFSNYTTMSRDMVPGHNRSTVDNVTTPSNSYTTVYNNTSNNYTTVYNATTASNNYTTAHNDSALRNHNTPVSNATTPSNNYTTVYNATTASKNPITVSDATTPSSIYTTEYNDTAPSNNYTTAFNDTALRNMNTTVYNATTPSITTYNTTASTKSYTTASNAAGLSNSYTTPYNDTTPTNNDTAMYNATTPSNNYTTVYNATTPNNNYSMYQNGSTTHSNYSTSYDTPTPSNNDTTYNATTPSKNYTTYNATTSSNNYTTMYNATMPSTNYTTYNAPTPSNNDTTASNATTANNNYTTAYSVTTPNNNNFTYNATVPLNNHTTYNATTLSNNHTTYNATTLSNNYTMYNATTLNYTPTYNATTLSNNDTTIYNPTIPSNNYTTMYNATTLSNNNTTYNATTLSNNYTTTYDATTLSNNYTTTYNATTLSNNYTTTYNPTTLSNNYTTMYNATTLSKNYTTLLNASTPSNNYTTTHNATTLNNNYTTAYNPTTPSNNYTTMYNATTLSNNYTTPLNATTRSNNYTTMYNATTISNNYTTLLNASTPSNNYTTMYNVTTTSNNYTTTYNANTLSNNHTTTFNPTTPSNNYTTMYNATTLSNNYTTMYNATTLSNNYTTTYNATTLSNNYTTTYNPTTPSNNYTTMYNATTLSNNYTIPLNATTHSNNYTTMYNATTLSNNYTTLLNASTPSNNYTTMYNVTTTSNNYTTTYNANTLSNNYTTMYNTTPNTNYTLYNVTKPSNYTTVHNETTPTNNYTTEYSASTPSTNYTTYNATTTTNNYTTYMTIEKYNTTGVNNNYTYSAMTPVSNNTTPVTVPLTVVSQTETTVSNTTLVSLTESQQNTTAANKHTTMSTTTSTNNPTLETMTAFVDNTTKPTEVPLINKTANTTTVSVTHVITINKNNTSSSTAAGSIQTNSLPTTTTSVSPVIATVAAPTTTLAATTTTTHIPSHKRTTAEGPMTSKTTHRTHTRITTTTTVTGTKTTNTTTVATTKNEEAKEEEANELFEEAQESSQFNSSQVSEMVDELEKLLDGPSVSQSVGQKAINVISNLMEADQSAISSSANRLIQLVDTLGVKLDVTGDRGILSSTSLVLAVKTVDGTNFPTTSVNIFDTSNVQLRALGRSRIKRSDSPLGSVYLPSSLTASLSPEEQQQASRVQFTFYSKNALFQDASLDNQTVVSPVLGSSVANLSISNLKENIEFTIRNINPVQANNTACVFWDFTLNGGGGGWRSDGCFAVNATPQYTTCSCSHLTSFAVLLDLSRDGIVDRQHAQILTFITYIGCGISAIFLALTLLTYLSFQKLLRDIPAKILVQLCLSLLFLNLAFLLDGWLAMFPAVGLCISTAFFLHYFLLTSFTWAGLEALHMYLSIVQVFTPYLSRYMLKFSLMGWGIPLIVVVIVISVDKDNYGVVKYGRYRDGTTDDFCWLRNDIAFYVGVVAYFLLIFALCLLVFIVVMVQLSRIKKQNPHNQSSNRGMMTDLRSVAGLIILLGLTWGFALFAWGPLYLPFVYLFSIFNSLQGFFVFVFHCAVKENVRRQWRTYLCCGKLRLAENSEWSRTATGNTRKSLSQGTATTSAPLFTSRSSSVISDATNSSGSVFADSGVSDGSNSDVVLNEIHRRNQSLQGEG